MRRDSTGSPGSDPLHIQRPSNRRSPRRQFRQDFRSKQKKITFVGRFFTQSNLKPPLDGQLVLKDKMQQRPLSNSFKSQPMIEFLARLLVKCRCCGGTRSSAAKGRAVERICVKIACSRHAAQFCGLLFLYFWVASVSTNKRGMSLEVVHKPPPVQASKFTNDCVVKNMFSLRVIQFCCRCWFFDRPVRQKEHYC